MMKKISTKKIILALSILLAVLILAKQILPTIKKTPSENLINTEVTIEVTVEPTQTIVELKKEHSFTAEIDEISAFELLNNNADIEYEQYDFGILIKSIDGLAGDNQFFWAFSVNDEMAQEGADKIVLKKGDVITFKYQKIQKAAFDD